MLDVESRIHHAPDFFLPIRGIRLLFIRQLQPTPKLFERVAYCHCYAALRQYPVPVESPLPSIVVPMLCFTKPSVDRSVVRLQPMTSGRPYLVVATMRYSHDAGHNPCLRM